MRAAWIRAGTPCAARTASAAWWPRPAAASQAVRDAHGPDLPEEVEALLDEADAQSAVATTRLGWVVPAAAPVACNRPNASLVEAAMHYRSAEDAAVAGSSAALEAYVLTAGPGDVVEERR